MKPRPIRHRIDDGKRRPGPAPRNRYERLNPGAKARRHALAPLPLPILREYCSELLWDDFRAGRLPHTRAIPSLAEVMAQALKHGAFALGIPAMADLTGVSPRTVIRGSKAVRQRNVPASDRLAGGRKDQGYLWRTRGRKGEGVTIWRPAHALVNAITAVRAKRRARHDAALQRKADRAELQRAIASARDSKRPNSSHSQCDTVAQVAAPWAAGSGGGGKSGSQPAESAVRKAQTESDLTDKPIQTRPGWRERYADLLTG